MKEIGKLNISSLADNEQIYLNKLGYKETGGIIIPNEDMLAFGDFIGKPFSKNYNYSKINSEISKSKMFLIEKFDLQKILYLDNFTPLGRFSLINPTDLPIEIDYLANENKTRILFTSDDDHPIFCKYIFSNHGNTIFSDYAHEVAHTQVLRQKGIIESYSNNETISILLELISAYYHNNDTLKRALEERLHHTIFITNALNNQKQTNFAKLDKSSYIFGTYKALQIFNIFLENDDNYKKMIIDKINDIFLGKQTVEHFLEAFECNNELAITQGPTLARSYISKYNLN